ncbi:hypothetical protein GT347_00150 [Xylophilus rhododendri]|uniref:WG repeat-containing protein n=1 Tax=Xylophilus rhododendri TaxID=2697032 RepID=A0A857J0Z4_9BURK|nr:WG repeat-containing protein [Xylophilus rhododendri]QHI96545.1 hypothetical protein GT347_00150 [Xylophilus rhododendri]
MKPFSTARAAGLPAALACALLCPTAHAQEGELGKTAVEPCRSQQTLLWGLCRADGSNAPPVVAQNFEYIGPGTVLFPARQRPGEALGYIDSRGQWRVAPKFSIARPFNEGLAVVSDGHRSAAIDEQGQAVVPWFDGLLYSFSQGLACFVPEGRIELGLLGRWRQALAGGPADTPYAAPWWHIEGKAGFLDARGQVVIAPQYEPKLNFLTAGCGFGSAGYAAMRQDGHEGLIDRSGRWIVQPEYDYLGMVFSGNRKVLAMIADRRLQAGVLLDTVERLDGFMGPDGAVRWRDTGPPREQPVQGGLGRALLNQMLFPRWQQDLTNENVSTRMLQAWLGSLALAACAILWMVKNPPGKRRSHAVRAARAVIAAAIVLPLAFLAGLLSSAFLAVMLLAAAGGFWLRWRRRGSPATSAVKPEPL